MASLVTLLCKFELKSSLICVQEGNENSKNKQARNCTVQYVMNLISALDEWKNTLIWNEPSIITQHGLTQIIVVKDHRRYHYMYVLNLSSWEKKPEKILGLNGNQTRDFCNAGAVLYQLSYQANWELITWWHGHGFDPHSSMLCHVLLAMKKDKH